MSNDKKFLVVTAENLAIAVDPKRKFVCVELQNLGSQIGLVENVAVMPSLTADEARQFGAALIRKADQAESTSVQQ